jgi:hypothetical protein
MTQKSVHARFFCAAGAIFLTSLSGAVFLATSPSGSSAAILQCVPPPTQSKSHADGENSKAGRSTGAIGLMAALGESR